MSADTPFCATSTSIACSSAAMDPRLLEQGQAHLFLVSLAQPEFVVEQLAATLTPDEHERAGRFKLTGIAADSSSPEDGCASVSVAMPGCRRMRSASTMVHSASRIFYPM
jgi:hypothetical protein